MEELSDNEIWDAMQRSGGIPKSELPDIDEDDMSDFEELNNMNDDDEEDDNEEDDEEIVEEDLDMDEIDNDENDEQEEENDDDDESIQDEDGNDFFDMDDELNDDLSDENDNDHDQLNSDNDEENQNVSSEKKQKRKRKSILDKARELGYTGDAFTDGQDFVDADSFAHLINGDSNEDDNNDNDDDALSTHTKKPRFKKTQGKRKSNQFSHINNRRKRNRS